MDVAVRLTELTVMHPNLHWGDIIGAAANVLTKNAATLSAIFDLALENIPSAETDHLRLSISAEGLHATELAKVQRTYDSGRLVELAAIAIAGLGIYHGVGLEIRDVAKRGSGADYLVGPSHLLEIAGRSRRSDAGFAWEQRWERLAGRCSDGFFLCVAEFESFTGRLAFSSG